jgi:phenylpropionate dioxygenase-like ring-hydroxylating dioxygenase large terminal subunit
MEAALIDRLKSEIRYEFSREGPPEGFPKFPDIPAGRYRDQAFFGLEMKHLWPKVWLLAGRDEDARDPGGIIYWDYLGTPVFIVRGNDGVLRAFHNRAPEGGRILPHPDESHLQREVPFDSAGHNLHVQQEFPRYSLAGGVITCQVSGRVYGLDGILQRNGDGSPAGDCMPATMQLEEFRCETWDGWVFINQDLAAPPLLEWLRPIPEQMAQFQGWNLRTIDRRWTIIPCNWKVTVEAFQEVYHFKHIHARNGVSALDQRGATMGIFPNGHSRMITPISKRMAETLGMADQTDWRPEISRSFGGQAQPGMPEIPTVHPMVKNTSTAFSAFPNLITPVSATGMPFLLAWPLDVRTTLFEWVTFAVDWGDGPSPATMDSWQQRLSGFDVVMEEDTRNMAPMQKSLDSPGLTGMPVSYQERRIWNCAETVDRIIGRERIPEHLRVPTLLGPYIER